MSSIFIFSCPVNPNKSSVSTNEVLIKSENGRVTEVLSKESYIYEGLGNNAFSDIFSPHYTALFYTTLSKNSH